MSTRTKVWFSLSALLIVSLLAACTTPTPQVITQEVIKTVEVQVPGEEVVVTKEVEVEVVVTQEPEPIDRRGAWVDRIVMVEEESQEAAVTRIQAGELDVFAFSADDANVFETVKADPNLTYAQSFGSYNEMTLNPVGPTFTDGRLNPFSDPMIRESLNWLIDREYVIQEILSGLGYAKFLPITSAFPDYARYIDTVRELESFYAFNPEKANEVITTQMEALGATLTDGKWTFNGEPITIIMIIRVEDERNAIGDYVASQLETVGFTVDRQYKTRTEASPIWVSSDPAEGQWHMYTGGWITTAVDRDQGDNFSFFYTPRDYPIPLHQAYTPSEEFDGLALKLRNNDFTSMEERDTMFRDAMRLALQDSVRVWVADQVAFSPFKASLDVTYDLAGGISGAQLWPATIRYKDEIGGSVKIAQPGLLVDPWNPVAGSNWIYDMMPIRATSDWGFVSDPYTGLQWPQRAERAEIVAQTGLPIVKTLDWVDLQFADTIEVPADAWVDWDPVNQKFITAGEKFTQTVTAKTKSVVYYPADMFQTVKWHDGSPVSVGDFVMNIITTFDYGKAESPNFDAALGDTLAAFADHFKGVRIVSTDPLVIETYDDLWYLDAELIPTSWWPQYTYGPGSWHVVGVGNLADAAAELAFSTDKAGELEVEWMNFVAGPSLEILKKYLDQAAGESFIPYAATLGQYVTADEAATRYTNLSRWYAEEGHFWVGTGPFYLDKVFPVEGTLTLLRNEDSPDLVTKWAGFAAPKLATVEVEGPGTVTTGTEATFDVFVTDPDAAPYTASEITGVKWLLFDSTGKLAATGEATPSADGQYTVTLTAEQTTALGAGSNKLEVAVSPLLVSVPALGSFEFVTVAP
jgi:peptide/nickel transport system substrate-binding protein